MLTHVLRITLGDFTYQGKQISASRLGYRITKRFVHAYMGKIFDNPNVVFDEALLKPETQDLDAYADGICNIVEAQQRVAREYISDGSVENACPPLKAILYIMAEGHYDAKDINHPDIRGMFRAEYLLNSDWYKQRLITKQMRDIQLWQRHADYFDALMQADSTVDNTEQHELQRKRSEIKNQLDYLHSDEYLQSLQGSIGADWIDHNLS